MRLSAAATETYKTKVRDRAWRFDDRAAACALATAMPSARSTCKFEEEGIIPKGMLAEIAAFNKPPRKLRRAILVPGSTARSRGPVAFALRLLGRSSLLVAVLALLDHRPHHCQPNALSATASTPRWSGPRKCRSSLTNVFVFHRRRRRSRRRSADMSLALFVLRKFPPRVRWPSGVLHLFCGGRLLRR